MCILCLAACLLVPALGAVARNPLRVYRSPEVRRTSGASHQEMGKFLLVTIRRSCNVLCVYMPKSKEERAALMRARFGRGKKVKTKDVAFVPDEQVTGVEVKLEMNDVSYLVGKLLTIVDASYPDRVQREGVKSLVKQTVWTWGREWHLAATEDQLEQMAKDAEEVDDTCAKEQIEHWVDPEE